MEVVRSVAAAREAARALPRPLGFVPTMGALHRGHLALVGAARRESASVAASIFVNPLQFGPAEDFGRYPRRFEDDRAQLEAAGVALLFAPEPAEFTPPSLVTSIDSGPVAAGYEGALRPGHFRGVATIVMKLVHAVEPDVLYLGQKDAQQARVVGTMLRDLNSACELHVEPTVRDDDGLALSSRNEYLDARERRAAPSLHRALERVAEAVRNGERDRARALEHGRAALEPPLREAYLDVVDAQTFAPLDPLRAPALVIGSAWAGSTRLIDNVEVAA